MERDIGSIYAIKTLGYSGSACVRQCRCDELPCPLLTWLVSELTIVCPELHNRLAGVVLVGELKALLTDLQCPLVASTDTLNSPLLSKVIEFLVSELSAARILTWNRMHPGDGTGGEETPREQRLEDYNTEETMMWCQQFEDEEVADEGRRREEAESELAALFETLNMAPTSHLADACCQTEARLALLPTGVDAMEPLLEVSLTPQQWRQVDRINEALLEDYQCRRQMTIKRFQVTLESFAWGGKEERARALSAVGPLSSMSSSSQVCSSRLLAARKDQSSIVPVKAGPSTAVYKVLMGSVPDRGGRPGEMECPMPSWTGRSEGGGGRRGRGRGGGKGRGGGRHQKQRKLS